ncbi:MAG: hypothetical protein R2710_30275 [Acidimicrobiales bacterium]
MSDGTNTVGVEQLRVNATSIYNQYAYDVLAVNGKVFVAGSQYYLQVLNESDACRSEPSTCRSIGATTRCSSWSATEVYAGLPLSSGHHPRQR